MSGTPYPRDMVGYGRDRPHPDWPGDARIAVQFVINYEEGAENSVLHGDAGSETLLTEFGFVEPRIGERALPVESMYEFGSRVGFWRLHRLFTERSVPVTVFGVAMALARNPDAVAAMTEAGWEIASHGYRWIDYHAVPEAEERAHIGRRSRSRPNSRAPARSAVSSAGAARIPSASWPRRAASSTARIPTPTSCPTGSRKPAAPC